MRLFLALSLFCSSLAFACTDFVVQSTDGTLINGRSLEFAMDLQAKLKIFPRNQSVVSKGPDGQSSIEWINRYGFLGVTALGQNFSFDGLNEVGLSFGYLWLPGITQYPSVSPQEMKKALDFIDLGAWILGNFSTVADVKAALPDLIVWGHPVPPLTGIPPVHAAIHDAEGNHLVIEFIGGEMKICDNPNGVLTNSPALDWHLINLQNYINLNALNAAPVNLKGSVLTQTGQGSGLLGIPGDWTPPSRFVRMTTYLRFAQQPAGAVEGVNLAEHLLNTVDIPMGEIRERNQSGDFTQWIVIKDLSNKVFYFRSYKDLCLKMIDLTKVDFLHPKPGLGISIDVARGIIDMTPVLTSKDSILKKKSKK